jgi:hypothetical protein
VVPEFLVVHVLPSGDDRIVPLFPTTTNLPFQKVMPLSPLLVPEFLGVQLSRGSALAEEDRKRNRKKNDTIKNRIGFTDFMAPPF